MNMTAERSLEIITAERLCRRMSVNRSMCQGFARWVWLSL